MLGKNLQSDFGWPINMMLCSWHDAHSAGHLLAYCPLQVCVIQGSELKGLEGQPHGE